MPTHEFLTVNNIVTVIGWIGDLIVLVAAYLITKGKRIAFAVFVLGDIFLMGVQIEQRIWNQVALFAAFLYINAKGWFNWKGIQNEAL